MAINGGHVAGEAGHVTDHNLIDAALALKLDATAASATYATKAEASGGAVVRLLTSAATLVTGDFAVVNAGSGPVTITLPASPAQGARVIIKKVDGTTNIVTVSGGLVEGDASLTLTAPLAGATLIYAGGSWRIVASSGSVTGGTPDATTAVIPAAPTNVVATGGNGQASVAFTASSGATSYTATSSPGGFTASGASSPLVVTGLTNGVAYTFTVTATNSAGTSPASTASNSITPAATATAPGAPTIGTASSPTSTTASVPFTAPASNGGSAITGYTATSTPGGLTGTGTTSPITVSGLTTGTAYTFKVKATNAIGTGPESAASNSVTPTGSVTPITTPADITNLHAWYDASQMGLADLASVSSFTDLSGNSRHLTQATSSDQPRFVAAASAASFAVTAPNGKPVIYFGQAGDGKYLDTAAWGELATSTIFLVMQDRAGGQTVFDKAPGGTGRVLFDRSAGTYVFAGSNLTAAPNFDTLFGPSVVALTLNGASSSIHKDGVSFASGNPGSNAFGSLRLGADQGALSHFTGAIAAVVVYARALSSSERQQVEAYLKTTFATP